MLQCISMLDRFIEYALLYLDLGFSRGKGKRGNKTKNAFFFLLPTKNAFSIHFETDNQTRKKTRNAYYFTLHFLFTVP